MNTKRWIVTYTKHIKQKRKVYQDGLLELCSSGDKVALYDDCEKLIDSRFLKKDEVVECGGMLVFETHLVDIGDPEERHIPLTDLNDGGRDVKLNERAGAQGRKESTLQSIPPKNHSNAMHGSIRERKHSEHGSSGTLQSHPDATQTILKEWNALYTTQITQKAKIYHDGILRLVSCGSHMNQVILLSEDWTILSSKYLKSVQCVESGHKYEFPNYLVEICELRTSPGDDVHKGVIEEVAGSRSTSIGKFTCTRKVSSNKTLPNEDLQNGHSEQVISCSSSDRGRFTSFNNRPLRQMDIWSADFQKEHSGQVTDGSSSDDGRFTNLNNKPIHDEWNALYSTQVTQKAKRYHDGILRLANCGSHMKQVILLNEDGAVLSSKYLKSVEHLETGHMYELPNYLVEICEPRTSSGDDIDKVPVEQVAGPRRTSIGKFVSTSEKALPKVLQKGPSEQVTGCRSSDDGRFTSLKNKPARDACQILSILKKPLPVEDLALRKLPDEHVQTLQSPDLILLDVESTSKKLEPDVPATKYSRKTMEDNHEGDSEGLDTGGASTSGRPCLKFGASHGVSASGNTIVLDSDYQGISPSNEYSISSNQLSGAAAPETSSTKLDMEHTGIECVYLTSSAEVHATSDSNICTLPRIIQSNSSENSISGDGFSRGPVDRMSDIASEENPFRCSSNGKQHHAESSSSLKENISADENRSLSDKIMTLQQEWTALASRVSTMGNMKTPISFVQNNTQADEKCEMVNPLSGSSPARVATDAGSKSSELQSFSN